MLHEMGIETGDRPGAAARRGARGARRARPPARLATRWSRGRSSGMTRMHELSPVLIANRGEIAVRVARTLHALGLSTVGRRRRDADAGAPRMPTCVDVVVVGSAPTSTPTRCSRAARASGARSVHPGLRLPVGERGVRARRRRRRGSTWIGPPPEAIELMGDKGARQGGGGRGAGVPVVPAGRADGGFPVVVKAVAGGGGKGMRVVRAADELEAATAAARREARAAFGDDRVLVERYLERPRHIEVQVLADAHGAVRASRRARVLAAAPPPEGRRGGAVAGRRRGAARADGRGRGRARARVRVRRAPAPSSSSPTRRRRRVLLPRDEHAAAGRASR